jgi:hypothetical protein
MILWLTVLFKCAFKHNYIRNIHSTGKNAQLDKLNWAVAKELQEMVL